MHTPLQQKSGFTIVELLIVIVIIAILAAITIVGYTGIQRRASTAAYNAAVDGWEKNIRLHYVSGGSFPDSTVYNCLGKSSSDFPATADFPAGSCGLNSAVYSDSVMNNFTNRASLPNGLLPATKITVKDSGGNTSTTSGRGVSFFVTNASDGSATIVLFWLTPVSGGCSKGTDFIPAVVQSGSTASDGSYCQYTFTVKA